MYPPALSSSLDSSCSLSLSLFPPLSTRRYEFSHASNRKLFLPPASPSEPGNVFYSPTKTTVFSDPYTCAHACIFALEFPTSFSPSTSLSLSLFLFLFSLFIVVNPKSTFYISRRVYSKRIFFRANRHVGKRKRGKENRRARSYECVYARCVDAICDSLAYCKTSRLVRRSWPRMYCVRTRARKITGNESS